MTDRAWTPGDLGYTESGEEVRYLGSYEGRHLVAPIEVLEDEQERMGGPRFVDVIHPDDHVAVTKRSKAVADLDAKITEQHRELLNLRNEIREASKGREDVLRRIKEHKTLARLDDFLAGKLTHYVVHRWGKVEILDASKETCGGGEGLRLLVLFGKSKGNVGWRQNRYSDGSGQDWDHVTPCTSLEEARVEAQDLIEYLIDNAITVKHGVGVDDLVRSAVALNLKVKAEHFDAVAAEEQRSRAKRIAAARAEVEKLEAEQAAHAEGIKNVRGQYVIE